MVNFLMSDVGFPVVTEFSIVPNFVMFIFIAELIAIAAYFVWSTRQKRFHVLNKLYLTIAAIFSIWACAILLMKFTDPSNIRMLFVLDCITSVAYFIPALSLCIAISFILGCERLPKQGFLLFIIPTINVLICCTNELHHLQYINFSVVKSEIVFGPYVYVTGIYSYVSLLAGVILMIRFAVSSRSRLYLMQSLMFGLAFFVPLIISLYATFIAKDVPIYITPISFSFTIIFNGVAIYQLHLLDIRPIATERILNWISDGYLILSENELVVSYNKPFEDSFAQSFGISENRFLRDCIKERDISHKTAIFNMISALDSCRDAMSIISYEQTMIIGNNGDVKESYYVIDVSPLVVEEKPAGFVFIFKDVTQLRKSMQRLQESQAHLLEQEHFVFLGQMIGGIAHNLKTPIMGITGCITAVDALIDECEDGYENLTYEDYVEIYGEIREWFVKARAATSYMSDIITAIKGQATTVSNYSNAIFTVDDLVRRSDLLMRHEFSSCGCTLNIKLDEDIGSQTLAGDVNNLTQVLNNILSNAIYAQTQVGGGEISLEFTRSGGNLCIRIADTGPGILPDVRKSLFREMVTSKGTKGSGLGLYISNTVVRSKFNGSIWAEDNPGGGSIFVIQLPIDNAAETQDPDNMKGDLAK